MEEDWQSQASTEKHGPWNPGISSQIPRDILPLSTMFSSENVLTGFEEAHELSDFSGLPLFDVIEFRPERLIAHEVLVRVTADLSVRDGPNYEDLGISLRGMVTTVLDTYVEPKLPELVDRHQSFKDEVKQLVDKELREKLFEVRPANPERQQPVTFWQQLFSRKQKPKKSPLLSDPERVLQATSQWERMLQEKMHADQPSDLETALFSALSRVVNVFMATRGRLAGGFEIIAKLATTLVVNDVGGQRLGKAMTPIIAEAALNEEYKILPAQEKPVVMNVKGASASGKSTMRAHQRALAKRLDISWEDFALISPDYWRKFMLDYDSLGQHYKYAGVLTGHELVIIDRKLDRYMADKGRRGAISHLLVDRFRFDSFSLEEERGEDSRLLTRFGKLVFLFFVVTPPEATVERAWKRGLVTGRYKAVEDLLHHNIEAYTGMPKLFFSWAFSDNKRVHFEFLDNSVKEQQSPRTIAYGWNDEMTILDVQSMRNIERFRNVNISATTPEVVYRTSSSKPSDDDAFLAKCLKKMRKVRFQSFKTGEIAGEAEAGRWAWKDLSKLQGMEVDDKILAILPDWKKDDVEREEGNGDGQKTNQYYVVGDTGFWRPNKPD